MHLSRAFLSHFSGLLTGLILAILIANSGNAQQKVVDSLSIVLGKHTRNDTVRLNLLIKISTACIEEVHSEGLKYADSAILLAKHLNQKSGLANATMAKGLNIQLDNANDALNIELTALNEFNQLHDERSIAKCNIALSHLHYALADYVTAVEYAKKAVNQAEQIHDEGLAGVALTSLGVDYIWLAEYPTALACHFKALNIFESLKDRSYIAKNLTDIGLVLFYEHRYAEALTYDNKGLDMCLQLHQKIWIAAMQNNIGDLYLETHDYSKAIDYNKRALAINLSVNVKRGVANDLMSMGVAYGHLNNYADAFDCLGKAITIYDTIGAKNNTSLALGSLALLYCIAPANVLVKQGINPVQRFSKALQLQLKAVQLAHEVKNLDNESQQQKNLSLIYERQHNYQQALNSYRAYTALKDSVFNDKKRQEIDRLAMQYDFDKKEALLKAENDKKQAKAQLELARQKVIKNASIAIGLIVLAASAIIFNFYKRRKDARERQKDAEFKVNVAETELKVLRSQLNPHFIFNSLNSIGDYIARRDKETADNYLTKFARLIRLILENSENETISLAEDLYVLELYMQLEVLRSDHKFLYEVQVDEAIDIENTMVPPMILQPFVENSIWHGLSPKNGGGKITISVKKHGEMIAYTVQDNGIGRDQAKLLTLTKNGVNKKSFGIKVIQSRIDILNEIKQSDATVEMTDLDEGTRVSINLPLELKF